MCKKALSRIAGQGLGACRNAARQARGLFPDQAFRAAMAFCSQSLPSTKRETM